MELLFIERFNGMFAIGAWNKKDKKLYLIRDRYGIKPFTIGLIFNTLVFPQKLKELSNIPKYELDVDLDALNEYFTFQNIFSYNTLFKGG